jgi:hypothetical protein
LWPTRSNSWVVHAAASSPNGVDQRLRRNPFTIDSLPHEFRPAVYVASVSRENQKAA